MWQTYDVQVPDVLVSGKCDWQRNSIQPRQQLVITQCRLPSRLVPSRQMFQLCAEHYRLYCIEPRVEAHARVMMFYLATEIAQCANCGDNIIRIGQNGPAVTVPAQVLTGIKLVAAASPTLAKLLL